MRFAQNLTQQLNRQFVCPLVLTALVGAAVVCAACLTASISRAQGASPSNPAIKVDLKTTLEKGLRCRRPQEFAYVAAVIEMVDSGELPETLVRNIFGWARRRQGYPLQAFQFALQRQAARLGINDVPTIQNNSVNLTSSSGS